VCVWSGNLPVLKNPVRPKIQSRGSRQ
jgi:hypothetical protein